MAQVSQSQGSTEDGTAAVRRIGLIEDHESVALGLKAMLADEPDLDLVIMASTVDELLAHREQLDLVVLDLRLGDGSSPRSNVEQLHAAGSRVLVYTGAENAFLVRSAARAGVLGVVRKSAPASAIVSAIRRAAMALEVIAIAVVETGEIDVLGGREPAAGIVIDEDAPDALPVVFARFQEGLDFLEPIRSRAADFHAIDHAREDRIGQLERVLGMLRQRAGEIGHLHFGMAEIGLPRLPFAPDAERQNGDAGQRDKSCHP